MGFTFCGMGILPFLRARGLTRPSLRFYRRRNGLDIRRLRKLGIASFSSLAAITELVKFFGYECWALAAILDGVGRIWRHFGAWFGNGERSTQSFRLFGRRGAKTILRPGPGEAAAPGSGRLGPWRRRLHLVLCTPPFLHRIPGSTSEERVLARPLLWGPQQARRLNDGGH